MDEERLNSTLLKFTDIKLGGKANMSKAKGYKGA